MGNRIVHASSLKAALAGRDHVVLLAPARVMKQQPWRHLSRARWTESLKAMAQAAPGDMGKLVSTWPAAAGAPKRMSLGILPDEVSRHVAPSRAHAIASCCDKAELSSGKSAVVLVLDGSEHWTAAVNAVGRALRLYSRKTRGKAAGETAIVAIDANGRVIPPPPAGRAVVEASRWAASLVDRPTSELDTAMFVDEAQRLVAGLSGVRARVILGEALLKEGLRGIHAVGRAADVAPRMLILEHSPRNPRRVVALVGKGVVYDTGGLALKPRDAMTGMKGDMGGGAAVVGAFRVLAETGSPDRIVALVPLVENAIGPKAYRNDDILDMHSGRTVEVNNTDAEGRILLADGCSYAVEHWKPQVLIDAATLTGAQLIATGKRHAGIVSNREGLERRTVAAGLRSGDLCHPLPFAPEFFQREFKSDVADMKNSVKDRANAQSSCAAQFVWSHVEGSNVPWVHVDLAGPAEHDAKGTGFGVALIAELVSSLEAADLRA